MVKIRYHLHSLVKTRGQLVVKHALIEMKKNERKKNKYNQEGIGFFYWYLCIIS